MSIKDAWEIIAGFKIELVEQYSSQEYDQWRDAVQTIHTFLQPIFDVPKTKNDPVNHPTHYNSHPSGVECIEITRHYCFAIGNAIKYLWRAGLKHDADKTERDKEIEDLEKAVWYINDRIKQLKEL
jgi:hypothetical protein